jgi:arylsulfatase A-like enzyme
MNCAQELHGWGDMDYYKNYPRLPTSLDSMTSLRQWIDGYDVGIRYMDDHIGQIVNTLADLAVLDETIIVISADHGENQGELGVWGDHQTADHLTCRVPLIVRWPGLTDTARIDHALHYQFDWAATLIELLGGEIPANWDGQSFAAAFGEGRDEGRDYLVLSQGAHVCQRAVRFDDFLCIRTYHDGYKLYDPMMLFDLDHDPHEQRNLSVERPGTVDRAMRYLADWQHEMMLSAQHDVDPLLTVLREGGPLHAQVDLPWYLDRLRATGRAHLADRLAGRIPGEG